MEYRLLVRIIATKSRSAKGIHQSSFINCSPRGFTLLELVIAISIMAVLSLFTQQSIQSALRSRNKLEQQMHEESQVLSALRLIQTDISMAFHFRDINIELTQQKQNDQQLNGQNNQANQITPPPIDPSNQTVKKANAIYITQFQGKTNEIYLSTISHYRAARDSKESDYAVVGYYLKPCKSGSESKTQPTQCLWRKINFYPDLDITRGGIESVVIEDVENIKFRYLGDKQRQLMDRWSSGPNGEDFSRGQFPIAVEVELRVKRKPLRSSVKNEPAKIPPPIVRKILVPIRFPNNPVAPNSPTPGTPGQEQTPEDIKIEE